MSLFSRRSDPSFVVQIVPPANVPPLGLHTLETLMQSLVVPSARLSLEIVQRQSGPHFLLRATKQSTLSQATRQLQTFYPQAVVRPVSHQDDPLHLEPQTEQASALEVLRHGPVYESLRQWEIREWATPHNDPMYALLSVGAVLPASLRLVSQLSLTPLSPKWAHPYSRLALEHPLEQERQRQRETLSRTRQGRTPGWGAIIGMGLLVLILSLWRAGRLDGVLPAWGEQALLTLLHGQMPVISATQRLQLILAGLACTILLVTLSIAARLLVRLVHPAPTLYDPRRIADKLSKRAYQARLRLVLIETTEAGAPTPLPRAPGSRRWADVLDRLSLRLQRSWLGHMRLVRWLFGRYYALLVPAEARLSPLSTWMSQRYVQWRSQSTRRRFRQQILTLALASYRQYETTAVGIRSRRCSTRALRRTALPRSGTWVLTGEEVALLWHPLTEAMAGLEQRQERTILAPADVTSGSGWKVGISEQAGMRAEVFYPPEALRQHAFVLGRTGKGKSTLFEHLAQAQLALRDGHPDQPGLCVIEPHGDLIRALLRGIPAHLAGAVTLIDLAERDHPVGFNLLDVSQWWNSASAGRLEMDLSTSAILTTLRSIWIGSWGSRIENVMRYSLRALMEANLTLVTGDPSAGLMQQYSLLDVVPLLQVRVFRRRVLDLVHDPFVLEWWHTYYEQLDAQHQQDLIMPVISKISAYASSETARRIIGQPCSTIDLEQVIRTSGLLLINTASGEVGTDISSLLGATILSSLSQGLSRQYAQPQAERRAFLALVDEFANYPVDYGVLLTERRKAGLSLVLAAQSLTQLEQVDAGLRSTVLGNSEHLFVFTPSVEDAVLLREVLAPLTPQEVIALPDYLCYAHWARSHKRLPLFSFELRQLAAGSTIQEEQIRATSTQRDGRPQAQVDTLLAQLHALHHQPLPPAPGTGRGKGRQPFSSASNNAAKGPLPHVAGTPTGTGRKHVRTRKPMFAPRPAGSSHDLLEEEQDDVSKPPPPPLLP
ncbi:hypothetical protein KSF_086840 [Reticulibacter mediterranei]|uniref:Type IV secretion system coupling protein TraD DNA-binding domain-containing protein n=1 Tax=Reticulibacter mediterranei TaxID=2778369 RepID=A0A8J3IQ04_9CHLR|nr:type IV secretory system conjugative DNA transfer family protein [Reticulibacter mediterranei]GHO98636.1 hypothetical protein KSF_086840 [Reticulibacter mediterranei]